MSPDQQMKYENIVGKVGILGKLAANMKSNQEDIDAAKAMQCESSESEDEDPDYIEGIFTYPALTLWEGVRCQKSRRHTTVVYDNRSLWLFGSKGVCSPFRKFMVRLVHHPIFDNFIILATMMNTFNLAVYEYDDRDI